MLVVGFDDSSDTINGVCFGMDSVATKAHNGVALQSGTIQQLGILRRERFPFWMLLLVVAAKCPNQPGRMGR